ncbi:MAG: hypothetical protein KGL74_02215 [Elusimicrobia bacterium]|nr:hypothetical protein [Elusimicrobiota bacterium]MDE2509914.1 hypothetical protein [Elusimicrobiota bacterium]
MLTTLLTCLLGLPCAAAAGPHRVSTTTVATSTAAPTPTPGTLDSSKIRLDAHDAKGALADAELVLAKGGGADAYAARADAKRALGQPMDSVLADYALAAKLDPRYIEKYQGLIAQSESEKNPKTAKGGTGLGGVPVGFIALSILVGMACIAGGVLMSRDGKKMEPPAQDVPGDPDKPKKDIS